MSRTSLFHARLAEQIAVLEGVRDDPKMLASLHHAADAVTRSVRSGGRILLCGNGGSAADAQHLAAELVGRFVLDRRPFSAIALGDNISAVTAIGNDYGYDDVFERSVLAHGRQGDVLIGLSTSGRSQNVVRALQAANGAGLATIALAGPGPSPVSEAAQIVFQVDGPSTARIQEAHKLLGHTLFEIVESECV